MFYEVVYFDDADEATLTITDSFLIFEVTDDKQTMRRVVDGERDRIIKLDGEVTEYTLGGMEQVISEEEYFLLLL